VAITVTGVTDSVVTAADFSTLLVDAANFPARHSVPSGFSATVSASTRAIVLAAGRTWQAGTNLTSSGSITVPIAANGGTNPLYDVVYTQVDWTGTSTTAGSTGVKRGSASANPQLPTLTQTAGVLWQTPICYHLVNPGSGLLNGSNLTLAHPMPHGSQSVTTDSNGMFTVSHNLWVAPSYAEAHVSNSGYHAAVASADAQTITVFVRALSDGSLATNKTFTAFWKVAR